MIHFVSIDIEGFASIARPFSYNLNHGHGLHLIIGKNGSGKSTIFNALCWALYGKTLKSGADVETWENLRPKEYKGTKVEVIFGVGLEQVNVVRCQDYKGKIEGKKGGSSVFIYINGQLYTKHKNKADLNKKIEEILGMSFQLFRNSLMFGQNLTRLLREKGDKQKELFDEAFSITYINRAKEQARANLQKLHIEAAEQKGVCDKIESTIGFLNESVEEYEAEKKTFELEKAIKLDKLLKEKNQIKADIKGIKTQKRNYFILKNRIKFKKWLISESKATALKFKDSAQEFFKAEMGLAQAEGELVDYKNRLSTITKHLSSAAPKCPHCGQVISKDKRQEHDKKLRTEYKEKRRRIPEIEEQILSYKQAMESLQVSMNEKKLMDHKVKVNEETLEELKEELENLGYYPDKLKDQKIKYQTILNQYRDTRNSRFTKNIEAKLKKLEYLRDRLSAKEAIHAKTQKRIALHEWLIQDALSNKGLKAYVFNSMIQAINRKLAKYENSGGRVEFIIDLDSGNKSFRGIIYQGNEIRAYEDLSGGEQQLVDVSLAFAMHDVIAEKNFNILLMDEVFESLDKDNIEYVIDMIRKKAKNTSIHVVTHRKEFVTSSSKTNYLSKNSSGITGLVM